jgi:hypothetical protein
MIKRDQPVFLVNTPSDPNPNLTIEEIAESSLPHLLAAHPSGPFRIGGFCNGGLVAWELAHQLERLGRRVELVVLIDTLSINARPPIRMIGRLARLIAAVVPQKIGKPFISDAMAIVWKRLKRASFYGPYLRAMSNYLPPRLRSDVALVICEKSRMKRSFSSKVWTHLAPSVQTRYVSGSHVGCITTHARELASLLDGLLIAFDSTIKLDSKVEGPPGRSTAVPAADT